MRLATLGCVLMVGLAACGGSDGPTAPSVMQVSGTWEGTITSSLGPQGSARMTLNQSRTDLAGTWSVTGPGGTDSGVLSGQVNGGGVTLTLTPSVPTACGYAVMATVAGTNMTGTYSALDCTVAVSGALSLTRR